ncbi:MAG TPA: sulfite exporter TauE/SafE family protein [Acetobacteraceae bacterium]|nr:sulfite exporter TauE/SafE family protein [Acetobacteraceae bacterium]
MPFPGSSLPLFDVGTLFALVGPPAGSSSPARPHDRPIAVLGGCLALGCYIAMIAHLGLAPHGVAPIIAVFIAALASSVVGFAFSAAGGAILFHVLPSPVEIIQILLVCSIANQALSVWALRRAISWRATAPFLLSGMLGAPAGAWLLLHSEPHAYLLAFGVLLIGYSLSALIRPQTQLRRRWLGGDWLVGLLGGLTGGFAASPGAPLSIWLTLLGWDKLRRRAVYQPFILVIQCVALVSMQAMARQVQPQGSITGVSLYLPASLLGTWYGLSIFAALNDNQFTLAINLLLIVSGLALVL